VARGTALAPGLIEAYRGARYVVRHGNRTIRLRVDDPAPWRIRRWLGRAAGAVFVTAAAPRGIPRHAMAERAACRRLAARAVRSGTRFLAGEGGDEAGQWPAEASLLIALRRPAFAPLWGRQYAQNAVLWVPRRGPTRLVLLR
jgi:hypothetical protein